MPVYKEAASKVLGGNCAVAFANPAMVRGLRKLKLISATHFAIEAHAEQKYGDEPYAHHLAAVVRILEDFEYEGDYLVAGWLHDVVEDTAKTLEDVRNNFGGRVANLVDAVSGGGDRESHTTSIYRKIAAYPDAAALKLADRIANIENCVPGDKHALRYQHEHEGFTKSIRPFAATDMWDRYERAIRSRTVAA